MSGHAAENFNFKVTGGNSVKKSPDRPITLGQLLSWIESQSVEKPVMDELKRMASSWPDAALAKWKESYRTHLTTARNKVR